MTSAQTMHPPARPGPYDPDLADIIDGLEQFVRSEVVGRHRANADLLSDQRRVYTDRGSYVPEVVEIIRDVRGASADAGFFSMCVPTDLGGQGLGYLAYFEAWKRILQVCTPHEWLSQFAISHWAIGPSLALEGLTPRAKRDVLPGLIGGREIMCFGMSEPDAGSDAMAMRTNAVAVDGGWRISGRKIWTSYSPIADWMILFAVTDPELSRSRRGGISAFLVPMSPPGIEVHAVIRMFGEIGGIEGEVAIDDLFVEDWQLIGELDHGFQAAMKGVSLGRIYNAARGYALGKWALDVALDYAAHRSAFGRPIAEHQAVLHPLAESAMELHASHTMTVDTARRLDAGLPARKELAMAKLFAVQAGCRAADRAMQTHGAMGFTNELGISEAFISLRKIRVADGTDEILLRTIGKALIGGDRDL